MRHVGYILLVGMTLVSGLASAQSDPLGPLLREGGQQFCSSSWNGAGESDQRLYQACLLEQGQARQRLEVLSSRYGRQGFFQDVAIPFCRSYQNAETGLNLVEFSFCLDDEILGYQTIQDLRRRYGGNRVDSEINQALAAVGSWAAAASQVKRSTTLKTVRQGI